ncbi:Bug family tripartite tricarboxylate transporter substrate binding protein [Jannaschia pohangensis]|uniref:Putative tricarboxylic transport membrane protein n=1 Tax=Jannaschia pohangensis TaxID=390807 RepID=A0A1I3J4H9_9RHOB|nr:tripartite tricarboxylate transporter substrate-binding protein [Jannaschia pohangensis]SFI55162.1 putative tricarboxylic transport membrane protein [Jannaschia pohangensis]
MTNTFRALLTGAAIFVAGAATAAECIAPANPGGGWDFTCRQIGKILYDIGQVDQPVQVTNMAGGGGGLAFQTVVNERNDDPDLIVAASVATQTRLAQNAFGGATADQVRFVGAIGADPGVIVVAADSPFQSLTEMMDAMKADPGSVAFAGGSAAGGFDHLKVLQLAKAYGIEDVRTIKYIGVDGGADAITQTIGGFTQGMTGDMSEIVGFVQSGDVRVLAVLTEERVPGFDDIPTAREQGIDIVAVNWRGLYVPKGISDERFQEWADRLQAVADSDEWKEAMAANGLAPFTRVGNDFQAFVDQSIEESAALSREIGIIQ